MGPRLPPLDSDFQLRRFVDQVHYFGGTEVVCEQCEVGERPQVEVGGVGLRWKRGLTAMRAGIVAGRVTSDAIACSVVFNSSLGRK